jgi:hypothetical protein
MLLDKMEQRREEDDTHPPSRRGIRFTGIDYYCSFAVRLDIDR